MNWPIVTMRSFLALILVIAFGVATGSLFWIVVPETNKDLVTYMLGQLSGMVTTSLAYYFVSSKSQGAHPDASDPDGETR